MNKLAFFGCANFDRNEWYWPFELYLPCFFNKWRHISNLSIEYGKQREISISANQINS